MVIEIKDLGLLDYNKALELQRGLHLQLIENRKNKRVNSLGYLLLTEHPPVITLGKHAREENVLLKDLELANKGIGLFRIERGGDVTYHSYGQLVVYPIIDLDELKIGVKAYVNILEEAVIRTLDHFGITAHRKDGAPGVWIGEGIYERKICALGIKCSHFCTLHGLALNVNIDLKGFSNINPCGFTDRGVTSMENEIGEKICMQEVKDTLSHILLSLILSF